MIDLMIEHAREELPRECCGLVVASGKKVRLVRARNLALKPRTNFDIDPAAWLQVADHEEVVGVYHSHTNGSAQPSLADRAGCEASGVPWHIVALPGEDYSYMEPKGFRAPYTRRPYVHGVHDCYGVTRDWYLWEWGLELPNFYRGEEWWLKGENLYLDNFAACGFVEHTGDPQVGDLFLIQVSSDVPNHSAIYLGGGRILHHVYGRLSSIDAWGGYWVKHRYATLRHKTKMGITDA